MLHANILSWSLPQLHGAFQIWICFSFNPGCELVTAQGRVQHLVWAGVKGRSFCEKTGKGVADTVHKVWWTPCPWNCGCLMPYRTLRGPNLLRPVKAHIHTGAPPQLVSFIQSVVCPLTSCWCSSSQQMRRVTFTALTSTWTWRNLRQMLVQQLRTIRIRPLKQWVWTEQRNVS